LFDFLINSKDHQGYLSQNAEDKKRGLAQSLVICYEQNKALSDVSALRQIKDKLTEVLKMNAFGDFPTPIQETRAWLPGKYLFKALIDRYQRNTSCTHVC
jgi:hypothetical protein